MKTYKVSVAPNRFAKLGEWKNYDVDWDFLVKELTQKLIRTKETYAEYLAMKRDEQGNVKDRGGFVGGWLKDGNRRKWNVLCRSLITFDLDECPKDILDSIELMSPYKMIIYSTHKHSPESPRLRLIIPLTKECSEEEYEPISRMIAKELAEECGFSMDCFDRTTHEPNRLMYFPTASKDGEFIGKTLPGKEVDPTEVLTRYDNWKDITQWPTAPKEEELRRSEVRDLDDPSKKDFIIGYFCSVFGIKETIENFLSDVYIEGTIRDRYTYIGGDSQSANGAIVYNNTFLYSHHEHDPVHGQGSVNAFDLVRIHKFGELDKDAPDGTKSGSLPSYRACKKWAEALPELKEVIDEARNRKASERAKKDFEWDDLDNPQMEEDDSWMSELQRHPENHKILETYNNYSLILNNDPRLKGLCGTNQFSSFPELLRKTPWKRADPSKTSWTKNDDAQLFGYINKYYGLKNKVFLDSAMEGWCATNSFDPVKDYIESVKWDGVSRIEKYFIDYLGADDNEYVRTVTRKMFIAGVARIYDPGCKFDYLVTLVGKQGIGKSFACRNLAGPNGRWFSDSISGAANLNGKDTYESLLGQWIVEWGELAALKKNERESVKLFLSKQTDTFRIAYGKRPEPYPRRCIFIGTTNDETFLNDATGARRFLIIDCHGHSKKKPWDVKPEEINQLWAEAKTLYDKGENIMDLAEVAKMALEQQEAHTEENEYLADLAAFLDTPVPKDWYKKSIGERQQYFRATHEFNVENNNGEEMMLREVICPQEFWVEGLGRQKGTSDNYASRRINEAFTKLGWKDTRVMTISGYKGHKGRVRPKSQPK